MNGPGQAPGQGESVAFVSDVMLTAALRDFVAGSGLPLAQKPFPPSQTRRVMGELVA